MRARALAFGLGIVGGFLLAVVPLTYLYRSYFRHSYPTGDTATAFFNSYYPDPVIKRFACGNIIPTQGGSGATTPGLGFVRHQKIVTAKIEIDQEHWLPLMQALAVDASAQLHLAPSVDRTDAGKDMTSTLSYQDGRALGTVTIAPLVAYDWIAQSKFPRHPGCMPVLANIYIDEIYVSSLPLIQLQREIQVIFDHPGKR